MVTIGKVFISHSSVDKPFVRRLAKRIEEAGFSVWLDEKELKAGDSLSKEIAEAVGSSKVVIVVVSAASIKSRWLKYELNIATERMVTGTCRVIPVVISDVDLPSEVAGLLYADFRTKFGFGLKSVLTALKHEHSRAVAQAPLYMRIDDVVDQVFDGRGFVSSFGGYKSKDWDEIDIPVPSRDNPKATRIFYDSVQSYNDDPEALDEWWWREFRDFVETTSLPLALVVTNRPIDFEITRLGANSRVGYRDLSVFPDRQEYAVFVDLHKLSDDEWATPLKAAEQQLITFTIQRRQTEIANALKARRQARKAKTATS